MGLSGGFFADVPIFSDIDLNPELRAFFVRYPFLKKKPGCRAPVCTVVIATLTLTGLPW